jgi:hypothetical protein
MAKAARPVLHFHPALAARARRAYAAVNERDAAPEPVGAATRAKLDDYYGPSLQRLRTLLTGRGQQRLPSWLAPVHR